ncbi:MAG: 1,4-dihydroxy-2-naphthoate octaprenyltransferase [Chloroherpetonaceae bacterium]
MELTVQPKPSAQTWWIAFRPFSFTASVIPAVMGAVIALVMRAQGLMNFEFSVLNFVLCILGCVAIHIVTNLVNDYYDHKTGLDNKDNFGALNILVQGALSPKQVATGAIVAFLVALAIGAYFIIDAKEQAHVLIYLVLFGALSAYFYTAPPLSLKYRGLGDLQVILSFATLMMFGAYFVQTKEFSWLPILYSIPIGLLVDDILHINNLRDIPADRKANISTLAIWLGENGAKKFHYLLSFGAFVSLPLLVLFAKLTPFALLAFLALPAAIKLSKEVQALQQPNVDPMIVARAAQLHAQFGVLMILGLIIGIFVQL